MADTTTERVIRAAFEVTGWDENTYLAAEAGAGTAMAQVEVRKTFTGPVAGTSVARLLTAGGPGDGRGYVASERFEGTIEGRRGTIVFQHGAVGDSGGGATFGNIVPGTGTAELAGLRGTVAYQHDENGAVVTLTLLAG
jgi:uncharacterized protein DUF3224